MYSKEFRESLELLCAARGKNMAYEPPRLTEEQREQLLSAYHPDYKKSGFKPLSVGADKGKSVPRELCDLLEVHRRINKERIDLSDIK